MRPPYQLGPMPTGRRMETTDRQLVRADVASGQIGTGFGVEGPRGGFEEIGGIVVRRQQGHYLSVNGGLVAAALRDE